MIEASSPRMVNGSPPYSRWARNSVIAVYGLIAVNGAVQIAFPDRGLLNLLVTLLIAITATFWVRFDCLAHSKPILPILLMLYFLLWPIGATIYLVSRSGWRGLGLAIIHAIGLCVTLAAAFYTTFLGLHFAGLLDGQFYPPQ